ncbi:MAG: FAD-dependent oxidoreductase [Gemmatimonadetes bacterium]|nr:FAD-dependent oxidoreductase [Gemmatimonadota bacterium]
MSEQAEILIVGGGAIGVCSAYYLNAAGRDVTLVDKGDICSGCSYGNGGLVVPSHSIPLSAPGVVSQSLKWMLNPESPFYIKPRLDRDLISWLWHFRRACNETHVARATPVIRAMNMASVALFEDMASLEGMDFGFEKRGTITAYRTERGLAKAVKDARFLSEMGVETRVLDADEIVALNPGIRIRALGGIFFPEDAHLVPHRFVRGLADYVGGKGVRIHRETEVLGFEISRGRVVAVKTNRGDFQAEHIILAGGSWSPVIAKDLRINLPIQPAKGYSITFKRPDACPTVPFSLGEAKVGITPMGDMLRFAGTLELAGLDFSINQRRVQAILRAVPDYFPDLSPDYLDMIEIWCGLRPCTPDGVPFLGRAPGVENVIVAAGHAMIGISLGPVTGKLVAELISDEVPSIDLSALKVDRFG